MTAGALWGIVFSDSYPALFHSTLSSLPCDTEAKYNGTKHHLSVTRKFPLGHLTS